MDVVNLCLHVLQCNCTNIVTVIITTKLNNNKIRTQLHKICVSNNPQILCCSTNINI